MTASNTLTGKRCVACEGGIPALSPKAAEELLKQTPGWQITQDGREIIRYFEFHDFHQTMAWVNALAWIAHCENHHPDLKVGYNYCAISYSTHAVGGITENDFICAAKINHLWDERTK